jgi:hypothetical protein
VTDLRGRERLGQVVAGATAHRLDRGVDGRVGGDDHDVEAGVLRHQPRDEIQPGALGELEVHEGQVEHLARRMCERGLRVGGQADGAARALESEGQRRSDVLLVVDDEDAEHRRHCARAHREATINPRRYP